MNIKGTDEYALKLSRLGRDSVEIAKKVVMAGANPVADEIRANLEANIRDPAPAGKNSTGIVKKKLWKIKWRSIESLGDCATCC